MEGREFNQQDLDQKRGFPHSCTQGQGFLRVLVCVLDWKHREEMLGFLPSVHQSLKDLAITVQVGSTIEAKSVLSIGARKCKDNDNKTFLWLAPQSWYGLRSALVCCP
eukprot:1639064-Amphidinium_carterae.1